MDENKVTRFSAVLGGGSRRGCRVWGLSRFLWKQGPRGQCRPFELCGQCSRVWGRVRSKVRRCVSTQMIRWSGRGAWDAPRGDSSRYIFRFRKNRMQLHKWRWVTAWIHFMQRPEQRGRRNYAIGSKSACNSPLFTKAAPSAVSPVCSAATGPRRPRQPGPATAFPVRHCDHGARRWPCRFAHMELAVMSRRACISPVCQQSPMTCRFTAPRRDR